jgi:hypothetical protein
MHSPSGLMFDDNEYKEQSKSYRYNSTEVTSAEHLESEQHMQSTHVSAGVHSNVQLILIETVLSFCSAHKYVGAQHKESEVLIGNSVRNVRATFPELVQRVHRSPLVVKRLCLDRGER